MQYSEYFNLDFRVVLLRTVLQANIIEVMKDKVKQNHKRALQQKGFIVFTTIYSLICSNFNFYYGRIIVAPQLTKSRVSQASSQSVLTFLSFFKSFTIIEIFTKIFKKLVKNYIFEKISFHNAIS